MATGSSALIPLAGWISTYLVHSMICCGLALTFGRWLLTSAQTRDRTWKLALLAPFVTATIATMSAAARPLLTASPVIARSIGVRDFDSRLLAAFVCICALLPGAVATGALVLRRRRAFGSLRDRVALSPHAEEWRAIPSFVAGRAVTLTSLDGLSSPVALPHAEICLPASTFDGLSASQRRVVLAHEIAHLERRDPQWLLIGSVVAAIAAVQPLNRLVVKRMQRDAEFICDGIAVSQHSDPRGLVESLAIFAASFDTLTPAVGSLYVTSPIVARAERLLDFRERAAEGPWNARACLAASLVFTAVLAVSPPLGLAPDNSSSSSVGVTSQYLPRGFVVQEVDLNTIVRRPAR